MNGCLCHHTLHKDLDELAHAAEEAFADFAGTQDAGAVAEALEDVVADGFLLAYINLLGDVLDWAHSQRYDDAIIAVRELE